MSEQVGKRIIRFAKGDFLFKQNESTKDLYIIKSGKVRVYKTEGALEIDLDSVGPGMVVGEVASIDGGVRSAFGVAVEDTEAIVIPSNDFQGILDKIPDWFRKIALILVQRLREIDERINQSIEGDRSAHVAAIISCIASSENCKACSEGLEMNLKFAENEIMDILNIPITDLIEILDKLQKQDVIKMDKQRLIAKSKASLDQIAEGVFRGIEGVPVT